MKKNLSKYLITVGMMLVIFMAAIMPASAKEVVLTDKGLTVKQNQYTENVIVFGHNATINGSAHNVVIINGNLKINKTAHIRDLVLVIGGEITQEKGAHVTSNLFSFQWNNQVVNLLMVAGAVLIGSWLLKFAFSLFLLVIGFLFAFLLQRKVEEKKDYIKQSRWKVILIGLATSIVLLAIEVILTLTVVGISIALILLIPILYFFFETLATLGVTIGHKIMPEVSSFWLIALVGMAIIVSMINFPLFGLIILFLIYWLSLSVMVMRLRDFFQKKKVRSHS